MLAEGEAAGRWVLSPGLRLSAPLEQVLHFHSLFHLSPSSPASPTGRVQATMLCHLHTQWQPPSGPPDSCLHILQALSHPIQLATNLLNGKPTLATLPLKALRWVQGPLLGASSIYVSSITQCCSLSSGNSSLWSFFRPSLRLDKYILPPGVPGALRQGSSRWNGGRGGGLLFGPPL